MGKGTEERFSDPFVVNVQLVAAVPISTLFRSCVLSASSDEIRCTRKNGDVVFAGVISAIIVLASGPVSGQLALMMLGIFTAAAVIVGLVYGFLYFTAFHRAPQ